MRVLGLRYDPVGAVIGLIDEAHATLTTKDLGEILMRVRPVVASLAVSPVPQHHAAGGAVPASPAVEMFLRPVYAGLVRVGGIYADDRRRELVSRLLVAYVDEVAARPRSCVVAA
jgi:hypothetical protein